MEPYFELTDWLLPDNTMSQAEAIKYAVWFCIDYEFTTPEEALNHLKMKELKPFLYSSDERQSLQDVI